MDAMIKTSGKPQISLFIPYRKTDLDREYYLQKRDDKAVIDRGLFGLFGGHLEGAETPEEALSREVHEELAYVPKNARYFSRYEGATRVYHLFIEEVGPEFESTITVQEGEYGKLLSAHDSISSPLSSPIVRFTVAQLDEYLLSE